MKTTKRFLSALLAAVLCMGVLPMGSIADLAEAVTQLFGDVNEDGEVTAADLQRLWQADNGGAALEEDPGIDEDGLYDVLMGEECLVTFDPNGDGVENMPAPQRVKVGECAVEPDAPTREGYVFGGWYVDSASQAGYDFLKPCRANITLTAQWTTVFSENSYIYENSDSHIKTAEETMISYYDNILLAFLAEKLDKNEKQAVAELVDGEIVGQLCDVSQILQIRVRNSSMDELEEMAQILESDSRVNYATSDIIMPDIETTGVAYTDTDPWVNRNTWSSSNPSGENWAYEAIDVYQAWHDYSSLMNSVNVAVIDSGFDLEHEDLKNNLTYISTFGANTNSRHGTAVAGIIGAEKNSVGMCGIAYNAELWCVDADNVQTSIIDTLAVYDEFQMNGVDIINLSMGCHNYDSEHYSNDTKCNAESYDDWLFYHRYHVRTFQYSYSRYIAQCVNNGFDPLFIEGAGNGLNNEYYIPTDAYDSGMFASCTDEYCLDIEKEYGLDKGTIRDHIIIVTSIENIRTSVGYQLVSGASRGNTVDICAPGMNVYATDTNGSYCTDFAGTSAATPIVTGVAALLKSIDPDLNAATIKSILINSATRKGSGTDKEFGYCEYPLVNARSAVEYLITNIKKGAVIGHVVESDTGEAISNAKVTLINTELNQKCTFQADSKGYIADFIGTLMRRYTKAKIEAEGYEPLEIDIKESNGTYDIGTIRMVKSAPSTFAITKGSTPITPGSSVQLGNGAGYQTWTINSNKSWRVTTPEWCAASIETGEAGITNVEIRTSAYKFTDDYREGKNGWTTPEWNGYPCYPFEEPVNIIANGTCGDNVTWTLDEEGRLTVSGSGPTKHYSSLATDKPWKDYMDRIHSVVVERGITALGIGIFSECKYLETVFIDEGVKTIGGAAFYGCLRLNDVMIPRSVTSIEDYAFRNCDDITWVHYQGSEQEWEEIDRGIYNAALARAWLVCRCWEIWD